MVRLHKKNILKSLGMLKVEETGETVDPDGNPYLNSNVLLETFVSCVREIENHPTLLVNHFIPRNLLLLDTKANIISSSLKYVALDNILNKLTERKKPKTVIISVSNGKELDRSISESALGFSLFQQLSMFNKGQKPTHKYLKGAFRYL